MNNTDEKISEIMKTEDIQEFEKWINYAREHNIRFKGKLGSL